MAFHGRRKRMRVKYKQHAHDKRRARNRKVARHHAKINEVLERIMKRET